MYICMNIHKIPIEIPRNFVSGRLGVALKGHGPVENTWGIDREYVCICGIYMYMEDIIRKYGKIMRIYRKIIKHGNC